MYQRMTKQKFSSGIMTNDYSTPPFLIKKLEAEFGTLYDPCPLKNDITKFNGLKANWKSPAFVNPPYQYPDITDWVKKCVLEFKKQKIIILLIHAKTDTKWFHDYILPNAKEIRCIKGRLKFNDSGTSPFPSLLVIFK